MLSYKDRGIVFPKELLLRDWLGISLLVVSDWFCITCGVWGFSWVVFFFFCVCVVFGGGGFLGIGVCVFFFFPPLHFNSLYLDPQIFSLFALLIPSPIPLGGSKRTTGYGLSCTCQPGSTHHSTCVSSVLLPMATRWHLDTVLGLGELAAVPGEPALCLTPGQQLPQGPKGLPTALRGSTIPDCKHFAPSHTDSYQDINVFS